MGFKIHFSGIDKFSHSPHFATENLRRKLEQFQQTVNREDIGFFNITEKTSLLADCYQVFEKFSERKHFVHIGIGGSSLGPEMLIKAFPKNSATQFSFINNIDPDEIELILSSLNHEECVFYFVSKSGGTAETLASLAIIASYLKEKGVQESDFKNYFVFATDPEKSQLKDLAAEWQISLLTIPSNIGGRFTVLTPVGFFPALFAGIKVEELLAGANEVKNELLKEDVQENNFLKTAAFLMALKETGIDQTVFMPYSSLLKYLSFWFVQLWAESLGKKESLNGELIYEGLTPIPGYGATDQHSQVQLFMEGAQNKCIFLIGIQAFNHDFSLENGQQQTGLKKLSPFTLGQLMQAELHGTMRALEENERPFIHLDLSKRDERNVGALIMFFESLTALMGHYLNIDPFDQPGVELGKKYAFAYLENDQQKSSIIN